MEVRFVPCSFCLARGDHADDAANLTPELGLKLDMRKENPVSDAGHFVSRKRMNGFSERDEREFQELSPKLTPGTLAVVVPSNGSQFALFYE